MHRPERDALFLLVEADLASISSIADKDALNEWAYGPLSKDFPAK